MYQKITQFKVLSLFMDNPYEKYYLREAARLLKISPMTLKRSLDFLIKNKLILKDTVKNQILYFANAQNPAFRYLKISYNLSWLLYKKLVEFMRKEKPGASAIGNYDRLL